MENKLKKVETITKYIEHLEYMDCRNELDKIIEKKVNGIRIRTKCNRCNNSQSLQNFFLILKNIELYEAQIEILKKIRKALHYKKELIKNFFTF